MRTPAFVGRPASQARARRDHGVSTSNDLTPEQYAVTSSRPSCATLPRLPADAPRDADGRVRMDALGDDEFRAYSGILGHYHVTQDKQDPGPAFDWELFLERVRAALGSEPEP